MLEALETVGVLEALATLEMLEMLATLYNNESACEPCSAQKLCP